MAVLAIFEELALKIKINENQFTIILFRKESKSEIKIEKFLFSKLDFFLDSVSKVVSEFLQFFAKT